MKPWADTPERVKEIQHAAAKWVGTPWVPNSAALGAGVSCHNLPRAILIEAGCLPVEFPEVVGDPAQMRWGKEDTIKDWLDGRPEFEAFAVDEWEPDPFMVGDVIGFSIGPKIQHLALYVGRGWVIHVLKHQKTACDSISDPTWRGRIVRAWRPVIYGQES